MILAERTVARKKKKKKLKKQKSYVHIVNDFEFTESRNWKSRRDFFLCGWVYQSKLTWFFRKKFFKIKHNLTKLVANELSRKCELKEAPRF